MAMTNAERQRRHRERQQAKLAALPIPSPEFVNAEDPTEAEPLEFLGMDRHEWAVAPEPLIDALSMRSAVDKWRHAIYRRLGDHADGLFHERWSDVRAIRASLGLPPRRSVAGERVVRPT